MTTNQPNNEVPEPMNQQPTTPADEGGEQKVAGGRTPQTQGPGRSTHSDDDMKQKRGGGNMENETEEEEDSGNRRGGQRTQQETDEEGGRSRQGGRSRNM